MKSLAPLLLLAVIFGSTCVANDRPNVLMIISDDQAWNDYGFMGHEQIKTPHLDRLARESLTFTRGYVTAPLCRPSLASMATGRYVHQHQITGNDPILPNAKVNRMRARSNPEYTRYYEGLMERIEKHPTFIRTLRDNGYLTLQTGKWWEGHPRRGGFTHAMTHGDPKRGGRHGDEGLKIGRQTMKPIHDVIRESKDKNKPFFIWYGVFLPHAPHNPSKQLLDKYLPSSPTPAIARYRACCEWFDQTCGTLLQMLEDEKVRDNTLVVYVCDNGWIQDPNKPNRFAPRSKRSPYDGGIRTPIMVHWPNRIAPKMDRETLVSSIDLAPTILNACKLPVANSMVGVDLQDAEALANRGNRIFSASYSHDADVFAPEKTLESRIIVDGWSKLIQFTDPEKKPLLFDLKADPFEKNNLAAENGQRVAELTRALDEWWDVGK